MFLKPFSQKKKVFFFFVFLISFLLLQSSIVPYTYAANLRFDDEENILYTQGMHGETVSFSDQDNTIPSEYREAIRWFVSQSEDPNQLARTISHYKQNADRYIGKVITLKARYLNNENRDGYIVYDETDNILIVGTLENNSIKKDDYLQVEGRFIRNQQGFYQIEATKPLSSPFYTDITIAELLSTPSNYLDQKVLIYGMVTKNLSNGYLIDDSTDNIRVANDSNEMEKEELYEVVGFFRESSNKEYYIQPSEITLIPTDDVVEPEPDDDNDESNRTRRSRDGYEQETNSNENKRNNDRKASNSDGLGEGIRRVAGNTWEGIKNVGGAVVGTAKNVGGAVVDGVVNVGKAIWDGVTGIFSRDDSDNSNDENNSDNSNDENNSDNGNDENNSENSRSHSEGSSSTSSNSNSSLSEGTSSDNSSSTSSNSSSSSSEGSSSGSSSGSNNEGNVSSDGRPVGI